nr:hypothetical protein [Escherichia coli]
MLLTAPSRGSFIFLTELLVSNFVSRVAVNHTGGYRGRRAGGVAYVVGETRAISYSGSVAFRFRLSAVTRDDFCWSAR